VLLKSKKIIKKFK